VHSERDWLLFRAKGFGRRYIHSYCIYGNFGKYLLFTQKWYGKKWVILWVCPCLKVNTYLAFVVSADHLI